MIIGIDASRANKADKTGTEWYAFFVINELKKLCTSDHNFILYSAEPLTGELSKLPKNFSNRVLKWKAGFFWTQIRLSIEMVIRPPDVLFVPAHTIPIYCPKKTYTTLHDAGFESFPELYGNKYIGPKNSAMKYIFNIFIRLITLGKFGNSELDYHRWSARLAIKKAFKIFTVSNFSKNEIQKFYKIKAEKISVIYNGYNTIYTQQKNPEEVQNVLLKHNISTPYVFFIGRLEIKKNIFRLVESFLNLKNESKFDNLKLVLSGKPGFGYEQTSRLIASSSHKSDIITTGWLNENELSLIMSSCSCFLFPSLYEGFGIPIIEAMASRVPVITSSIGSMAEISNQAAILVNPLNTEEITEAIKLIMSNAEKRKKLIKNGLELIKKYSWKLTASQILKEITI